MFGQIMIVIISGKNMMFKKYLWKKLLMKQ